MADVPESSKRVGVSFTPLVASQVETHHVHTHSSIARLIVYGVRSGAPFVGDHLVLPAPAAPMKTTLSAQILSRLRLHSFHVS